MNKGARGERRAAFARRRRRRLLIGCSVTLGVLLVILGIVWYVVANHLGALVAGTLRERAAESINGRLEFAKLDIDLGGRAVLTDAKVFATGATEPILTCPRVVVSFDFLTFIGPNRGRRAIVVELEQPWLKLVRHPDGGFNLTDLLKEPTDESEPMGVSVNVVNAEIDFTDNCLLAQGYPQLEVPAGRLAKLLAELGYRAAESAPAGTHRETLAAAGSFNYNPQRDEISFDARFGRGAKGSFTVEGGGESSMATYTLAIEGHELDLASLQPYVHQLFPALKLGPAGTAPPAKDAAPFFSGGITEARLELSKVPEQPVTWSLAGSLMESRLATTTLPALLATKLDATYNPAKDLAEADLRLALPGLELAGNPRLNLDSRKLAGKLTFSASDLALLLKSLDYPDPPVGGSLTAALTLGGTTPDPDVQLVLNKGQLTAGSLELGQPSGTVTLKGNLVRLEKIRTTGGDVKLTVGGSYDRQTKSGKLEIAAEALSVKQLVELARKGGAKPPPLLKDATGDVQLASVVTITDNRPQATLRAWAPALSAGGYRLAGVEASGAYRAPNIDIEAVTGTLTLPEPIDLFGFVSPAPLKAAMRVGGSVSYEPDSPVVLALVGTAKTLNLEPVQADASFKATGPAADPEIRLQLKTRQASNPLALSAVGHYRAGLAPFTARLTWAETAIELAGDIDLPGGRIDASLTADDVKVERFARDKRFGGTVSLAGSVKGQFNELEIAGALTAPSLRYYLPGRTYEVADASFGFKLVGDEAASISDGKLSFNGQPFTFAGTLGRERGNITLQSPRFDLFSALAAIPAGQADGPPKLAVESSGPFTALISGTVAEPQAEITYTSGPGSVQGHAFTSAALHATASLKGARIDKFEVVSDEGRAAASGTVGFAPVTYDGVLDVASFDVAILAPIIAPAALATLKGTLDGRMSISGTKESYSASGNLKLAGGSLSGIPLELAEAELKSSGNRLVIERLRAQSGGGTAEATGYITFKPFAIEGSMQASGFNVQLLSSLTDSGLLSTLKGKLDAQLGYSGTKTQYSATGTVSLAQGSYQGVPIDSARVELSAGGGHLNIDRATVTSQGSTLVASGSIGDRWQDIALDVSAPDVDLALLSPFLPATLPKLAGDVQLQVAVRPATGKYPTMEITLQDTGGGLTAGGAHLSSVAVVFALDQDVLTITQGDFAAGGNTLRLGGTYRFNQSEAPLELWARAADFSLDAVAGLVPQQYADLVPSGTIDCDLQLTGSRRAPLLSGTTEFELTALPAKVPLNIASASGTIEFTRNEFTINRAAVTTAFEGSSTTVNVAGSGRISLSPLRLVEGGLTANLAPDGQFTRLRITELFDGTLGGTLTVEAGKQDEVAVITGSLVVNAPGQQSTIWHSPPKRGEAGVAAKYKLRDLGVLIQPGTELRYAPVDLRVQLNGAVTASGVLGLTHAKGQPAHPDELKICGDVNVTKGSLFLYRHTLRLEGESNRVHFACQPGDLIPRFTGRAAVILPRVLSSADDSTTTVLPVSGSDRGDLKVIFPFKNVRLDTESGDLDNVVPSSDPPLPPAQIYNYLLGGVGDVLEGRTELTEFAEAELFNYGTGFISRALESAFQLDSFRLGGTGSGDNPFYIDMEKDVSDKLTFTYYRDFFNQTGQSEEFGLRYNILKGMYGGQYQNLDLSVNFEESGITGSNREFMFQWTTRF